MAGETPCVEWGGARNAQGYGVMPKAVHGSRLAHRAALAEKLGRAVQGVSRHTCDNPPCVNPDHLIEGTQSDKQCRQSGTRSPARRPLRPSDMQ